MQSAAGVNQMDADHHARREGHYADKELLQPLCARCFKLPAAPGTPTSWSWGLGLQSAHLRCQRNAAFALGQTGARLDSRAPAIGIGMGEPIRSRLRLGHDQLALRWLGERIEALSFGQFGNLQRAVDADLAVAQVGTNLGRGLYCLGGERDGLDIDARLLGNLPLLSGITSFWPASLSFRERRRLRLVVGDLRWLEMPPLDVVRAHEGDGFLRGARERG